MVDATAATEAKYNAEIERVQKQFGVKSGEDVTKFPTFNFEGKNSYHNIITSVEFPGLLVYLSNV